MPRESISDSIIVVVADLFRGTGASDRAEFVTLWDARIDRLKREQKNRLTARPRGPGTSKATLTDVERYSGGVLLGDRELSALFDALRSDDWVLRLTAACFVRVSLKALESSLRADLGLSWQHLLTRAGAFRPRRPSQFQWPWVQEELPLVLERVSEASSDRRRIHHAQRHPGVSAFQRVHHQGFPFVVDDRGVVLGSLIAASRLGAEELREAWIGTTLRVRLLTAFEVAQMKWRHRDERYPWAEVVEALFETGLLSVRHGLAASEGVWLDHTLPSAPAAKKRPR